MSVANTNVRELALRLLTGAWREGRYVNLLLNTPEAKRLSKKDTEELEAEIGIKLDGNTQESNFLVEIYKDETGKISYKFDPVRLSEEEILPILNNIHKKYRYFTFSYSKGKICCAYDFILFNEQNPSYLQLFHTIHLAKSIVTLTNSIIKEAVSKKEATTNIYFANYDLFE